MKNRTTTRTRRVPLLSAATAAAIAAVLIAGGTTAATAQTADDAPAAGDGWVRVAHLSPDTKSVDVRISAIRGGDTVFELDDVGYGAVSDYIDIADGTYVVSMVPADGADDAEPVVSSSVRITEGRAITVAAFGENRDLKTRVFADDLTSPEGGTARIRLVQASTVTDTVDVQTTTGLLIADSAESGSVTTYATVPAGPWDLELTAEDIADVAPVDLPDGSVSTLFVLDNSSGGLTVMSVLDSASVGAAPIGGVQTGGGALGSADAGFDLVSIDR